ncbi:hypothetical protein GCM10027085_37640 [Spirosoma aerophilum]
MMKRERNKKILALKAILAGKADEVKHYQQRIMRPLFFLVQKESDDMYSIRYLNGPNQVMTSHEYNHFIRSPQIKLQPVISIIVPEQ